MNSSYNFTFLNLLFSLSPALRVLSVLFIGAIILSPFLIFFYSGRRLSISTMAAITRNTLIVSFIMLALYSNFKLMQKVIFPASGPRYVTASFSRQVVKIVPREAKVATLTEMAYRFVAYNTENKYVFIHDGSHTEMENIDELLDQTALSYIYYYPFAISKYDEQIWKKIYRRYPQSRVIARFRLMLNDKSNFYSDPVISIIDLYNKSPYLLKDEILLK